MGVYNRNFVSIRIEDYPADKIRDLDHYFEKLKVSQRKRGNSEGESEEMSENMRGFFCLFYFILFYFISSYLIMFYFCEIYNKCEREYVME